MSLGDLLGGVSGLAYFQQFLHDVTSGQSATSRPSRLAVMQWS
jgi:hypothetical protein